nr:hypothetical protein [Tanacetum cinerariifolium]
MHAVLPLMTGIYMPSKSDFGIDESQFTYGPKQSKNSKYDAKTSNLASCEYNSSVETLESVPTPVESKPKAVSEPKVWSDSRIIEEYESDNNDESSTSTVRKVNTARPIVNEIRPRNNMYKSHSTIRRPFNRTTTPKANFANHKVNTVRDKTISAVRGNRETTVKASQDNPHQTLKGKCIVDSGCSRHMTGNKTYLVEYQDFNGGPVAFEGSKEFKNRDIIEFCMSKGIKREYSNARSSQQNRVAERKNMTLSEAARTILADSFLPNTFWAEAVSTACYVLNWPVILENKANKTAGPKEANNSADVKNGDQMLNGDTGSSSDKEPVDKEDQAFLEELERLKRQAKEADDAAETLRMTFAQNTEDLLLQAGDARASSTNYVNTVSTPVNTDSTPSNTASLSRNFNVAGPSSLDLLTYANQNDSQIPSLEDIYTVPNDGIFTSASYDAEGAVADFTNLESSVNEELLQFKTQQVWILVDLPFGKKGHRQEEGIDYDEEVYVSQPSGFKDPKFLKKVYKVVKALYGLHQALRAWYATLSTFLVKSRYIDKTLFIKKDQKHIVLVQVYVDDIIFSSTKKSWCEILKTFDFMSVKTTSTPIETKKPLVKDAEAADVDVHLYGSMISSLMYLTASRPDIMYAVCACFRFQVTPKTSHLYAMKRIFKYLKGESKLGLWYPRESAFDLEAYSDSDYARANLDRKSTTGGNFNKLDDLVGEGADYAVNKERSTDKIKVLNAKAKVVSAAGETLIIATLAVNTVSIQLELVLLKLSYWV